MGEKLGIDEIITMEDGEARIEKSLAKVSEKLRKARKKDAKPAAKKAMKKGKGTGSAKPSKADETEEKQEEEPKPVDVQEITKNAKPPSKENMPAVLEAAMFMSSRPMMLDELARITGINSLGYLKQLLEKLQKDYEKRGMEILNTRSGWQMHVRQNLLQHVAHLTPYSDIPEGCKRTLALVVYKEPMKQADLIRIQGNKAYTYIKWLKGKGLVRSEKRGRTMVIKLTQEFERYFGDERKRIKDAMVKEFGDPAKVFIEPQKPEQGNEQPESSPSN